MNIRNKLFILICLLSTIPLTAVGLISLRISKDALKKNIGIKSLEFAQMSMRRLNEFLYSKYSAIQGWAKMDEIKFILQDKITHPDKSKLLKIIKENNKEYYYIVCLNKKGVVIASSNFEMTGIDFSGLPAFKKGINGKAYIQDVNYNNVAKGYSITFSSPVYITSSHSKPDGVLLSAVKWGKINKMNSDLEIRGKKQDEANHVMLTTKNGLIISCDNPQQLFTNNLIDFGMKSAIDAQKGKEGYLVENSNHGLTSFATYTYFKTYRDMPNLSWLLILLQDPEALFASVSDLQTIFIIIILFTIALSFILSLAVASSISSPIINIASAAQAIGKGEMEKRVDVKSGDEIGDLAEAFNNMAEDIKISRDELIFTKDYVDNIIKSMMDILIVIDTCGIIKTVNNASYSLLGFSKDELVGQPVDHIFLKKEYFLSKSWIENLIINDVSKNTEKILVSKSGKKIPVSFSASVMRKDENEIQGIVCVGKDLTDKKRTEEELYHQQQQLIQADKMASLGILVSGVAHEINNPNNSIMFNTPTLLKMWNGVTPILEEYFKEHGDFAIGGLPYSEAREIIPKLFYGISDGSNRIKNIVAKLKGFSHKNLLGHTQPVDINKVTKTAISLVNSLIEKTTKHFSVKYLENIPPIHGNFQELEQVLVNLISNSCQALQDINKKIDIRISHNIHLKTVSIKVIDEGIGIPANNLNKIMEPFYTTKRDSGGTGLGLSVSFSIVKDHGGELIFSSKAGKGTSATIKFPYIEKK